MNFTRVGTYEGHSQHEVEEKKNPVGQQTPPKTTKVASFSAVITTKNRLNSLKRLLCALREQDVQPAEVIIIDNSDEPLKIQDLLPAYEELNISIHHKNTSRGRKRNFGVKVATHPYVMLCDDDVEVHFDYLSRIRKYLKENPTATFVSGTIMYHDGQNGWQEYFGNPEQPSSKWRKFFQQSRHGENIAKHHGWTKAGWPMFTASDDKVVSTSYYMLKAAVVRRDVLLQYPFDERIVHPVDEGYGLFLHIRKAHVLRDIRVLTHCDHKRSQAREYFFQVMAIDYFQTKYKGHNPGYRKWLMWSLVGYGMMFLKKGQLRSFAMNLKAFRMLLSGQNIYR